jgi:hypothetical protein
VARSGLTIDPNWMKLGEIGLNCLILYSIISNFTVMAWKITILGKIINLSVLRLEEKIFLYPGLFRGLDEARI